MGFGHFDNFPEPISSHLILSVLPTLILCLGRYSLFSQDRIQESSVADILSKPAMMGKASTSVDRTSRS
jgi:hypothetical protein